MDLRFIWRLGMAGLVALGSSPARAAEPAAVELVDIFAKACLGRFPDDLAIRQYAKEKRLAVMPAEQLHRLLGTDPGRGWLQNGVHGEYLLTEELPPFHTCAIRKSEAPRSDFLRAFSQLLGTWASSQPGASLKAPTVQAIDVGGIPSRAHIWKLERGPGALPDNLMAIVSNFPNGSIEVRLARAVGNR